jgi:hypothetical protein
LAIALAEDALAGHRDRADHQDPYQPNEDGDEDWDRTEQGLAPEDFVAQTLMADQCEGNSPPGERGVHRGSQEPGPEKVPHLCGLTILMLGRENTSNASEIHSTEGYGENGRPAYAGEAQFSKEIS